MSVDEIVGAAQILPQMGSKLPHFGAAFFVWGSLSMGSAIHTHIYNTYLCDYICNICPKFFKNCPKLGWILHPSPDEIPSKPAMFCRLPEVRLDFWECTPGLLPVIFIARLVGRMKNTIQKILA